MNVSFVVFGDLDERSGGFLYDRKLADRLEAAGDTVNVVSQRDGGLFRRLLGNNGGLLKTLESQKPDVVLIDELNHAAVFLLLGRIKRRLRVPVAALVHHLRCEEAVGSAERLVERAMEASFLRGVDAFIFNSGATAASVRALVETDRVPGLVAHPGKDRYASFAEFRRETEKAEFRVLFIGNLIPRKNLDVLIRALAALPSAASRPRWRLDVCGNDRIDPAYASRVATLARDFSDAVRFHGRVDDEETGRLLAEADVLAVPSDLEGFGIVYLEAMHAGAVPIASAVGGAAELVRDGVDGFLVAPKDEATLSRHLAALMDERALLSSMRESARRRAASFPTWEESMDRIRGFLHDVAEREKR